MKGFIETNDGYDFSAIISIYNTSYLLSIYLLVFHALFHLNRTNYVLLLYSILDEKTYLFIHPYPYKTYMVRFIVKV